MFEQRDLPFLHWVDDEFISRETAIAAAQEFPSDGWHTFASVHENGKGQQQRPGGPVTASLLLTDELVPVVEELTGISPLVGDLLGGGMHQTVAGGHLDVHVDFNQHPHRPGWRRALNLLIYLNVDWRPGDGGELELWDGAECRSIIEPVGGRAVLFPTSDTSWHGHPNPVAAGKVRRSLAVYFFTPGQVDRSHSTEWLHAS